MKPSLAKHLMPALAVGLGIAELFGCGYSMARGGGGGAASPGPPAPTPGLTPVPTPIPTPFPGLTPLPGFTPSVGPTLRPVPAPSGMPGYTTQDPSYPPGTPGLPGPGPMQQSPVSPASGGGPTSYPAGTVFLRGTMTITEGPGGVFSPSHVYCKPGAVTLIKNVDSVPHTFTGFNGATDDSGPIQPGGSTSHQWEHPGTWYFHDTLTPNAPPFVLTDVGNF